MRSPMSPILIACVVLPVLAGCAAAPVSAPAPNPGVASESGSVSGVPACPRPTVEVSTADELTKALEAARPGTVIQLADGRYEGNFRLDASGTKTKPIWLCGSADAELDGRNPEKGTVLHLEGASYLRVIGFTVQNGQKGVMADGVSASILGDLTVTHIGDEAIHLRAASAGNLVAGATISDTGLRRAEFGEGIYVGSAKSNWCDISHCKPDPSDGNRLIGNDIRSTTAEAVDIKEGTTGGMIAGNSFDGSALTGDADSWVDVKGNDWTVTGNRGTSSPRDGFQTHEIVHGWGTGNLFSDNTADVDGPGYGFALHPELGNTVACSNVVSGARSGLSNVDCEN